ncbi:penicillin-binding protein activator [Hyphomonas sp. FCG-A18]|uniref:penicillin-binding protein activator n=1 Tax=Hyphomonas sp. FCG-A18 TaxID=3080019 RepID=UPI002B2DF5B0|nr:penicillin-binding protein activator [Hyphomonas sp. FCG-A18]
MTSRPASRFAALAPSLFFSAFLILAGCATQPAGPVGPISSGQPRVDPVPGEGIDGEETGELGMGELEGEGGEEAIVAYTPPFMQDRELVRAGVALPFSHPNANVRKQAEGMLAAIELALFDHAGPDYVLIPEDTRGATDQAAEVAEAFRRNEVDMVFGPLFGANVPIVREGLSGTGAPIIAFSNDSTVAGGGAWLASVAPEEEVRAIVQYAALRGYSSFAYFGPNSALGQKVQRALEFEAVQSGGQVITSAFYLSSTINPDTEAKTFARTIMAAVNRGERVAVLVPERGNRLRRIAPLLAYEGVDTREVKMLGIGSWNDPDVWREPSLRGAWFPAAPKIEMDDFVTRYTRQYGQSPTSLGAVAYDAAALSMALSQDGDLTVSELTNPDGFAGVNGLFRFRYDGAAQRGLSILEIDPQSETGVSEVQPVPQAFTPVIN